VAADARPLALGVLDTTAARLLELEDEATARSVDAFGDDEPVLRIDTTGTLADVRTMLLPPLWAWRNGRRLGPG